MEIINGKVWVENTSANIDNIDDLDLNTYRLIKLLLLRGAKMEIGPGNGYGAGIYCSNLTIEQIKAIITDNENQNVTITADSFDAPTPEEEVPATDDIVGQSYKTIKALSKSYYEAELHGLMGVNTGDILERIVSQYKEDVLPIVLELPDDDKIRLVTRLEEVKMEKEVSIGLINVIINSVNISMKNEVPANRGLR
ncbi:MAG: hypothetical protein J1F35_02300 [Erysipelotrichales bacterium]|nr:hypothetical protein [Erysipelotrichales bacterium]